ncbi:MAG: hypothetical protein RMA76_43585 [Deltaproteobacteria bacterium]|jgi:hypothetical protein
MMRRQLFFLAVWATACDPGGFKVTPSGSDFTLRSVYVSSDASALIAGQFGAVFDWDGETFVDTSTDADPGPRVPSFFAAARVTGRSFIAGDDGTMLVRVGAGEFVLDDFDGNSRVLTMLAPTPSVLYAGSENGRLYRRVAADGERWGRVDLPVPGGTKITGGWAIREDDMVLTTDAGLVLDRVDGDWVAQTVATETSTTPLPLFGVWSSTVGADLFAVGLGGAIYRRSPPDFEWVSEVSPTTQDLYGIYGLAADEIFAVGANGTLLEYDGASWRAIPSGTSEDLYAVHAHAGSRWVVAVGSSGIVVSRRD